MAKLLYNLKCSSVCAVETVREIFSDAIQDRRQNLFVKIPYKNDYSVYDLCGPSSVRLKIHI